jgi:hypothetical protein
MLGSIQSGRCHLGSGLALADLLGGRRTQGGGRSHRDWAMDSDLLRIGGVHGLVFLRCVSFPTVASSYAAFPQRPAGWFSW